MRVHQGKVVGEGLWPPLWSVEQHHRLVAMLTDPARRNSGPGREARHLLTGIAKCGLCGKGLWHKDTPSTRAKGMPPFYACPCGKIARRQDMLDKLVIAAVFARLNKLDPALLTQGDDEEVKAAQAEAMALQARLDGFVASAADGDLTPRALAVIEQRLLPQIAAAQERARPRYQSDLVGKLAADPALWESFTVSEQREVVESLVTIKVMPTAARGRAKFRPEDVVIEPT